MEEEEEMEPDPQNDAVVDIPSCSHTKGNDLLLLYVVHALRMR